MYRGRGDPFLGGEAPSSLRPCCRSKPTGEQRQATRGAGWLTGLLVGPGPSVNGPRSGTSSGFWVASVPPDLVPDQEGVIY
jgi:hypothetical protein